MLNKKVDTFLKKQKKWHDEFVALRDIILSCNLVEEYKWGQPCYMLPDGRNIVLMHGFKEYCALLFFKGVLLSDPKKILIRQTENVQSARQIRFTHVSEIEKMASTLKKYIQMAIEVEQSGAKIELKKTREYPVPSEFQDHLDADSALHDAFKSLTPGRQRAYLLYFAGAKQSTTRSARVEKCIPRIFDGLGLND